MSERDPITGTIIGIRDYGPVVLLFVDWGEGRITPLPLERQQLDRYLEGVGPCQFVGRQISYDGASLKVIG